MAVIIGTNNDDVINRNFISLGVVGGFPTPGDDQISARNGNDSVAAFVGADLVEGGKGDDTLYGDSPGSEGNANDTLYGGKGNDRLFGDEEVFGQPGNDELYGGKGDDWVFGGLGTDILNGGKGDDTFVFGTLFGSRGGSDNRVDTGVGEGSRDIIQDFKQGADVIDVSRLLFASNSTPPDLIFTFIGTNEFTPGEQPQLRFEIQDGRTIVQMDGVTPFGGRSLPDGIADAEIELSRIFVLTADDFLL